MQRTQFWYKLAYPIGILLPWLLTPFAFFIASFIPKANIPLLYLTMVVFFAINVTVELAFINALSSFFAFSFFFAEPFGSIMIHHNEDLLTIVLFLIVSLLVGYIATQQKKLSIERNILTAQLEKERIEKENEQLRSALLSSVSHDFRTPLTSMIGATSTVMELGDQLDKKQTKELLQTVLEEAERLNRYTQNLLDMTRLGFGQLRLERAWVSIEEIMSVVKKRAKPLLIEHKVELIIQPDLPSLYVHAALMEQALFNILDNAIKHSPICFPIELSVDRNEDFMRIRITDSGPGIDISEREKVFERFYTANKGDRRKSGSGLGLTICRGMIAAHGGTVTISHNPNSKIETNPGCCVTVSIPLEQQGNHQ